MTDLTSGNLDDYAPTGQTLAVRVLSWLFVTTLFAFLINVYLNFWLEWPGVAGAFTGGGALGWLQLLIYLASVAAPVFWVLSNKSRSLRRDSLTMTALAAYIVRASFWAVLLVGIADAVLSFLRVEGLLEVVVGDQLAQDLGRNHFRAPLVHIPLIAVALLIALRAKGLGFTWLTLLVVLAELQIVISRFVFSYEQAFMGDLVRFWYGALFLFASAHTLIEDGHVRVDVLYASFTARTKGLVNALGALVLGIPLCWVVLAIGFAQKSSVLTSPLLAFEVTQAGFGMYVKYLLASFLAIFAITMLIQFAAYLLEGVADYRDDPGKREVKAESLH